MSARPPRLRELAAARRALRHLEKRGERHETRHEGGRVHWGRWGDGPALVLLHGGHGSWLHWVRNIEPLAARFSVLVPDMPGFGSSDALAGHPHDPNRQHRLVAALDTGLQDLLGAGAPFDLAGFSFGGLVAAQLAGVSGRVRRLALVGPAGHGGERRQASELVNWREVDGWQRWQAHGRNLQLLMLHDVSCVDAQALMVHGCSSHATRYRSKAISRDARLGEVLAACSRPLLLLWGEHDVTARPQEIGTMLLAGRDERQLRILAGAGHWVQYERSAQTNMILSDWFAPETHQHP